MASEQLHEAGTADVTSILDAALDAVIRMDARGSITGWNDRATETFGWAGIDVIGRPLSETIIPPQHRGAHQSGLERFLATGQGAILGRRVEITALHKDGREFPIELTVNVLRQQNDWEFVAFLRDITARKHAEAELLKVNERFQLVSLATSDAVWDWDLAGDTLWWNEGFETLFGYRRADIEPGPESWYNRLHAEDKQRVIEGIHAVIDHGGTSWSDEYRFLNADGTYSQILDRGSVIREEGHAVRMIGAMIDLTASKRAEMLQSAIYRIAHATNTVPGLPELLRQIHSIVGELLPAQNFYIALHDAATNLITFPYYVDEKEAPPASRAYGRGLTEYVLRTNAAVLAPPARCKDLQRAGEVVLLGAPSLDWMGVPLCIGDRPIGVVVVQAYQPGIHFGEREKEILQFVSTQIAMAIERKRVEAQLLESENSYRVLFDSNPEAMCVYDSETLRVLGVNDATVRRYGYSREALLGMTISDLQPESDAQLDVSMALPGIGPRVHTNLLHRRRDGSILDVEIAANDIVISNRPARLVLLRDVTERKQLESHFRQAQKMEAVGQLAGGIAHDFNNLLTAITGYSELLIADFAPEDPRRSDVEEIRRAAMRAAGLTQQLLAFSRKQMLQPRVVDLNEIVVNAEKLLHRLIGEHITLATVLQPGLGAVRADPAQIEQVIVNLAVNARDAMPEGGQLLIETANTELDTSYAAERSIVSPGGYVQLTVTDNGTGMTSATQARLFEPFFTTKGPGKGTGLGLSTVYGIVKQSGGFVWVYSELRKGTAFKIYLPRVDAVAEPLAALEPSAGSGRGSETVLLVEDEDGLRAVARRALERQGYTVLEAADGVAALAIAASHEGAFDLVVTDVVMPGMSGAELAQRLTALHPGVPVLFMSGYTDEAIVRHGVLEPEVDFIQKPFSPDALARRVREALDAKHSTSSSLRR